jgi:hypothetical protein
LNNELRNWLDRQRIIWHSLSAATAANDILACVTSSSSFQILNWGQSFQDISFLAGTAEVIEISAYALTEWVNSFRYSPASDTASFHHYASI